MRNISFAERRSSTSRSRAWSVVRRSGSSWRNANSLLLARRLVFPTAFTSKYKSRRRRAFAAYSYYSARCRGLGMSILNRHRSRRTNLDCPTTSQIAQSHAGHWPGRRRVYMGSGRILMEEMAYRATRNVVHKIPVLLEYKSPTTMEMCDCEDLSDRRSRIRIGRSLRRRLGHGPLASGARP